MRKKLIIGLLIFVVFFSTPYRIQGEDDKIPVYTDIHGLLKVANDYLKSELGVDNYFALENKLSEKKINPEMALGKWWGNMTITKNPVYLFVYGEPFGEQKAVDGGLRHRYLGYTMMDEEYPNMFFPDDTELATKYDEREWIKYPWDCSLSESVSKKTLYELCYKDRRFDKNSLINFGKPADYYRKSIIYGMGICYGLRLDPSILEEKDIAEVIKDIQTPSKYPQTTKLKGNFLEIAWEDYVHIIQPPTDFTWGIGRIWRQEGTYCNYLTIPLAPFIMCDNEPTATIWVPSKVKVGEPFTITAQGEDKDNDSMTHYFAVSPESNITGFIPNISSNKQITDGRTFYNTGTIELDKPGLAMLSGTVKASNVGSYTFYYQVVDENGNSAIAQATTQVVEDIYDFETIRILYDTYPADRNVNAVVSFKNNTNKAAENVPISLNIKNKGIVIFSENRAISMAANSAYDIYFAFKAPDENTILTIQANINAGNVLPETNKSNNQKSINAAVQKDFVPFGCIASRNWTEEHFSHYRSVQDGVDEEGNPIYRQVSVYRDYGYTTELKGSAWLSYVADPGVDSIKSGYGFRLEVETDVTASRNGHSKTISRISEVKGATKATVYFLGKAYPMEIESINSDKVKFYLPNNPNSVTGARKIYIPVNTPDGTYDISIKIEGADSPGGELCMTIYKQITVKGSMYEDDYTSPAER